MIKDKNNMKAHKNPHTKKLKNKGVQIKNGQISIDNDTLTHHRPPDSVKFHYVFYIPELKTARVVNLTVN